MIQETIDQIRASLRSGQFTNEASVSQGIVLPVLQALDWPVFNTSVVTPEFSVESGRVDYALREVEGRPKIFLEVKKVGRKGDGDRQLFQYAFHQGVPMAILTDGQEWSFYLPGEEGQYEERRVYKLDILERSADESVERLQRYLKFQRVTSGESLSAARNDYKDAARDRLISSSMPKAWYALLSDADELLVELLAEKVEDLCGYRPDSDFCSQFIQTKADLSSDSDDLTMLTDPPTPPRSTSFVSTSSILDGETGFLFRGQFHSANSAREVMKEVLITFAKIDPKFLDNFVKRKHGRKRRYIAQSNIELYPGRPDLARDHAVELMQGWWMGTNYGKKEFEKMLRLVCEVANVEFGKDLIVSL